MWIRLLTQIKILIIRDMWEFDRIEIVVMASLECGGRLMESRRGHSATRIGYSGNEVKDNMNWWPQFEVINI